MINKFLNLKTFKLLSFVVIFVVGLYLIAYLYFYVTKYGVDNLVIGLIVFGLILFFVLLILNIIIISIIKKIQNIKTIALEIENGKIGSGINADTTISFEDLDNLIRIIDNNFKKNSKALKETIELEGDKKINDKELHDNIYKLKRTEIAITNILEDLLENKREIEKKVEERTLELSQEKNKLNQITENMTIGAVLLDEYGEVIFLNNEVKKILNIKNNNLKTSFSKITKKFKDYPIKEYSEKCLVGESASISEAEVDDVIYEILFKCLKDNGKVFARLIWIRDITGEKLLERSKSELIAVASHQLKTPLTVTKGNTEMLLDGSLGKLNKEQKQVIQQTYDANQKLIALVNEMLDITKIEKNKLLMELEETNIIAVIESSINSLKEYSNRHNISVCFEKTKDKFPVILADKIRLQQVFQNLIENAIQYSRANKNKKICLVNMNANYDDQNIKISISDNGIGIPKKEQNEIFQRFYRASNAVRFASSGTGLGLYIVKSIIKKMGGSIDFESKEGVGTTFYITIPIINNEKKL